MLKIKPGTLIASLCILGFFVGLNYCQIATNEVPQSKVVGDENSSESVNQNAGEINEDGSQTEAAGQESVNETDVKEAAQTNQTDGVNSVNQNDNATTAQPIADTNNSTAVRRKRVSCLPRNETNTNLTVQVMDSLWSVSLQESSANNSNNGLCFAVLFYTPSCHFCAAAAPHYNALPRGFPDVLCLAIDASAYSSLNARLGIIGLPTLMLFHGGQPVAKFNDSQYILERFAEFITKYTGLQAADILNVTSADFEGPLSSVPTIETDYLLWLAWIFFLSCCCFGITKTTLFSRIIEALRNNWHEAEAHHHVD